MGFKYRKLLSVNVDSSEQNLFLSLDEIDNHDIYEESIMPCFPYIIHKYILQVLKINSVRIC